MDRLLREGNPPEGQLASPKPQYKKPGVDEYEPVEGQHGAPFAILKDASGNIVSPATEDKLEQVRQLLAGVATEAKLEQARGLLASISGKDFATQTTLAQVQSELALVKAELQEIKANQLSGDQKVQLSGNKVLLPINDAFRNTFIQPGQAILSDWINVQEYNSFWLIFATSVTGQAGRIRVQYRSIPFAGYLSQPSYTIYESTDLGNSNYPIDVAFNVPGQQIRFEYRNDGTAENRMTQFWLVGIRAQMNWGVVPWTLL